MNFGNWIVVAFLFFALFVTVLVVVCVRQDVSLVAKDYYERELNHQKKMDQMDNVNRLANPPEITFLKGEIQVSFALFNQVEKGELQLLRPSDKRLDRVFRIQPSKDTIQYFPLSAWSRGLYRVSMQWSMGGKKFHFEKPIVL